MKRKHNVPAKPPAANAAPHLPAKVEDITGQKFGRLTVVGSAGYVPNGPRRTQAWDCACECGSSTVVRGSDLRGGHTRSCGCTRWSHRRTDTPEYVTWRCMLRRCTNRKHEQWKNYGGRGITVCERWRKFENFYADMGERPSRQHSIDRIDNSVGYSPENCRWALPREQSRNTRVNRLLTHDGETLTLTDWSKRKRIGDGTIRQRLRRGWSTERALTMPPRAWRRAA
jgi:hypothetical protein